MIDTPATVAVAGFTKAARAAFVAVASAHVAVFAGLAGPSVLFACNLLVLLALAVAGTQAQRRAGGRFNSAVAAETIVAFGVLALILGLVTAVTPLLAGPAITTFDTALLSRLGWPFAQGLASAGLAPVIAVLVRINGAHYADEEEDAADEAHRLAIAIGQLCQQLGAAQGAAAGLEASLLRASAAVSGLAPDLARELGQVTAAAARIGPEVEHGVTRIATALDGAGAGLGQELGEAGRRVAAGFDECTARVRTLATAAQAAAPEMDRLTGQVGTLAGKAAETGELLEALNALTASVERFVMPRVAA